MGGRQRLYQDDKRVTIVLEGVLHEKITQLAKAKGLTVSRFLSLVLKKVLSEKPKVQQPVVVKVDSISQVRTLEDITFGD